MKADTAPEKRPGILQFIIRSFHYRNYRLYFGGQAISLIGTWIQNIALSWLVYRLTGSAYILGVVGFASQLPNLLAAPFAGVLVDRWNRYRTLMATQVLAMVQAFVLAVLVLTGNISVWQIVGLGLFLGIVNSFDITVRQSFVFNIVEKREDLGSAISLSTAMINLARLLGPAIAGLLITTVGEGVCFLLNGISYLAVIGALLAMNIKPQETKKKKRRILAELKEGFNYVFNSVSMRSIILLQAFICLAGWPATVLMPVFAKEVLNGGPHTLGFLTGFSGTGALLGTLYLASRKDTNSIVRLIPLAAGVFGIALIAFSQSRIPLLSMFLLLFTGFGVFVQMAAGNTVLQTIIEDDKRGRVMSIYNMAYMGTIPFGSLLGGTLADRIGAPDTLLIGGVLCMAGAFLFAAKYRVISETISGHLHKYGLSGASHTGKGGVNA